MELRQLEAFVAVASELHFGRAAERLRVSPATLSRSIAGLEREVGISLLTRSTRRVQLTEAGAALLQRTVPILDALAVAKAETRRHAVGEIGQVRVGITPPVATELCRRLCAETQSAVPHVEVRFERMWLPELLEELASDSIDLAIACGPVRVVDGVRSVLFAAEPLLAGLRPDDRLSTKTAISLDELKHSRMGLAPIRLYPSWVAAQRQLLSRVGIIAPTVELEDNELNGVTWQSQAEVDWILLTQSLAAVHRFTRTAVIPLLPAQQLPYSLLWRPRVASTAVNHFVRHALVAPLPEGWTRLARRNAATVSAPISTV